MLNGRHLILLGGIAVAGLLSVREGQRQIGVCYRIATVEKEIRGVKSQIQFSKIERLALQSPKAVSNHAAELRLAVAPANAAAPSVGAAGTGGNGSNKFGGSSRNAVNSRHAAAPSAPAIPALPNGAPLMDRTACR